MSSTDDAFIKAFRDRERVHRALELSQRKSFVVGTSPQSVSEFVAGVTQPVDLPETAAPAAETSRPEVRHQRHPTINDRDQRRSRTPSEQPSAAAKSVELRIDAAAATVVPAPHLSASALAPKPETTPAPSTATGSTRQPTNPDPSTGHKNHRIEPAHRQRRQRHRSRPGQKHLRTKQPPATQPQLPRQRPARPLVATTITPMWEVDALQWPQVCRRLHEQREDQLAAFVRRVLAKANGKGQVIAVTECERGEGATTLALCLARLAAGMTDNVAVVDGDLMKPQIARSLGLSFAHGWEEVSEEIPVAETAISARADQLVVVPLGEKSGLLAAAANHDAACRLLEQLSHSFQLVILDVGSMVTAARTWFTEPTAGFVNTGLVVQDVRNTLANQVDDLRNRLVQHGIDEVFIVENFHDQASSAQPTPPHKLIR